MVDNQNPAIIDRMSEELKESNIAVLPRKLANDIQPILDVSDRGEPVTASGRETTTSTEIIFTTPTDKDFYLTSCFMAYTKDVACDNVEVTLKYQPSGGSVLTILMLLSETLTAGNDNGQITYFYPIKLERGSQITLSGAFTVGTMDKRASITGYTKDTIKK